MLNNIQPCQRDVQDAIKGIYQRLHILFQQSGQFLITIPRLKSQPLFAQQHIYSAYRRPVCLVLIYISLLHLNINY